ncbi:Progestin and adipoQ receptor-like protein [Dirofilaria immitis]
MDGKEISDTISSCNRIRSGNFLLDVNEALQEAQQIMTDGKPRERHPEHVLEESTTVEVVKTGGHGDPIEIVVTRSTVMSQPNTDDEGDGALSGSDSESFLPSQTKSSSLSYTYNGEGSSDEIFSRCANVHYRRKRGDNWRLDDGVKSEGDGMKGEDDGHFEVEVKAEYGQDDDGEPFVKKSWEATWRVQKFEYLPEWLQDNEYLRHGHRPPLPSFAQCFRSILSIHTETGNIWTHLIGCLAFALLAAWFMTRPDTDIRFQEKVVFSFFFAGAIICLGMSFTFHTVSCHSVAVVRIFCKLDYLGISLLIIGSFVPWLYYGFYCRREPKITYIAMVCVLGVGAIIVSLWDKFSESRYRPIRAGVFLAMGCSGVVPTVHFMITDGIRTLFKDAAFHWLLLMAALYILGTLLYATRTPERFFPGKCDILACFFSVINLKFQSHQLFHVCVVIAAFVHYYGISEMAMHRIRASCPMESDAVRAFHHIVEGVKKAFIFEPVNDSQLSIHVLLLLNQVFIFLVYTLLWGLAPI